MSLRFSATGPEFPGEFVDSLLAGDVVFLCGTGISAPQLPDFKTLVDKVYERLDVEQSESQKLAYDQNRFEEVLGSVSRDLANPSAMVEAAAALLAIPAAPELGQARTIVRLSRDLSNRVLVVTTNFDTLLERAIAALDPHADPAAISFAGQALPAPGGADFSGIIHIHGRLADAELALESTPLVLTSSDYGDAYMRSGWASRFLFDLARCKTIALVGYSANDAPVRYFLNVLEADRARFPDLRRVYALDSYAVNREDAERPWGTVAVTPIAYCKNDPETGAPNHSPLWNDLRQLADLVERPKPTREAHARRILSEPSLAASDDDLRELRWLLSEGGDLTPTVIDAVIDPRWFEVLFDNQLWRPSVASWAIPAWIARDFVQSERLPLAAAWQGKLGKEFTVHLARRINQAEELPAFYAKAWRLLLRGNTLSSDSADDTAYLIQKRLQSNLVLDADFRAAIDFLVPRPTLRRRLPLEPREAEQPAEPKRFGDLIWADFEVPETFHAQELVKLLQGFEKDAGRILDVATEALDQVTADAVDFEKIEKDHDDSDFGVPSIEDHPQNEHHDSTPFLIRVLVNAHAQLAGSDPARARALHSRWWRMPGRLGKRLVLDALRDKRTASGDEAFEALLALGDDDFWIIRREIARLLEDRGEDTGDSARAAVEARILTTGEANYQRYEIAEGQADWRQHALDMEVWLRLSMLQRANALSAAGAAALEDIRGRREYLAREIEDQDYFHSYSGSVRTVVGDTAPIIEAAPDDRLEIVHELVQSHDIERQQGWNTYCRSDPRGAFETLASAELSDPNLLLWRSLLSALSFGDEAAAELRADLMVAAMAKLEAAGPAQIQQIASPLADVIYFGPRDKFANFEDWCDRLWNALRETEQAPEHSGDLHGRAINSGAGRLAQALISELGRSIDASGPDVARQRQRLRTIAAEPGHAGLLGRAIFAERIAYLLRANRPLVEEDLVPRMQGPSDEARALRHIMITAGSVTPELSVLLPDLVEQAIEESAPSGHAGDVIAAQILRPAIAQIRGDDGAQWGIDIPRIARMLRRAPDMVRAGALAVIFRWQRSDPGGAEAGWDTMTAPFFDRLWPKEAKFADEAQNKHLVEIAVGAGDRFPEALQLLRWNFKPLRDRRPGLFAVKRSEAPEKFPREVLDLLWTLIGPTGPTGYDLAEILDRLRLADPALEVDRRLQSLDQRTIRLR